MLSNPIRQKLLFLLFVVLVLGYLYSCLAKVNFNSLARVMHKVFINFVPLLQKGLDFNINVEIFKEK
jgi:hypothetical protein